MIFPILSAILGIIVFLPFNYLWPLSFVFLAPLFIFYAKENNFWRIIAGTLIFRVIFELGTVYYTFEPIVWLESNLLFLGLPISILFIKKILLKISFNKKFFSLNPTQASGYGFLREAQKERAKEQASEHAGRTKQIEGKKFFIIMMFIYPFFDHLQAHFSLLPTYIITAGNAVGSSPFLGLANFGGLIFLTFFVTIINTIISFIIINTINKQHRKNLSFNFFATINGNKKILIIFLIIILGGLIISKIQLSKNSAEYNSLPQTIKIAAISNNEDFDKDFSIFTNDIFISEERLRAAKMITETLAPLKNELSNKKPDLVVLPEDMIDIEDWNGIDEDAKNKFNIESGALLIQAYRNLTKELNASVATTFTTHQNGKIYNTMILFSHEGEIIDIYNKSRLTFSSEYWPFKNWQPFYYNWLAKTNPSVLKNNAVFDKNYRYEKGEWKNLKNENYSLAQLICVEAHYPAILKK